MSESKMVKFCAARGNPMGVSNESRLKRNVLARVKRHAFARAGPCRTRKWISVAAFEKNPSGDVGDDTETKLVENVDLSDSRHTNSKILCPTLPAGLNHEDIFREYSIDEEVDEDGDDKDDGDEEDEDEEDEDYAKLSCVPEHNIDGDDIDEDQRSKDNDSNFSMSSYSEEENEIQEQELSDEENDLYDEEYSCQAETAEYLCQLPPYRHEPLSNASSQLRLLRFVRSPHTGIIACVLQTFHVDVAPVYVAISYVWGSPEKSHCIDIGGQYLMVTKNCHYALWQVTRQLENEHLHVWVDSVCIQLSDLNEKAAQVRMMGAFYERASTVYACVGKHYVNSRQVLDTMRALEEEFLHNEDRQDFATGQVLPWLERHLFHECSIPAANVYGFSFGDFHDAFRYSHVAFCNREYWTRIWIIQEVWLANDLQILCGESAISVDPFVLLWQVSAEHEATAVYLECKFKNYLTSVTRMHQTLSFSRHLPDQGADHFLDVPYSLPSSWQRSGAQVESSDFTMDIITASALFNEWGCSDFRDRVYALQRIVAWPKHVEPLIPDYDTTGLDLFHQLMARLHPFIERNNHIFYELDWLLKHFGLAHPDIDLERLMEECAAARRNLCQESTTNYNRTNITICWEDTPLNICTIQATAEGHMWADLEEASPKTLAWSSPHQRDPLLEDIRESKDGFALHSKFGVVGRLPETAQSGDLLLKTDHKDCPCWLVLRQSEQTSVFNIEGIALIGVQWEASTSGSSHLSRSAVRLFTSPDDLLSLSWVFFGIRYYDKGEVEIIHQCLTNKLVCSSTASVMDIKPGTKRSISPDECNETSSSIEEEVTYENMLIDR